MDNNDENYIIEEDHVELIKDFDAMGLKEEILRGIYSYGYEKPSAIQQKAILPTTTGRDIIAQAQSGTGKTATFTIACLQMLDISLRQPQAILLAPTRELATQTNTVVNALGDYLGVRSVLCIGGINVRDNVSLLRAGCHVVVGTPGRVLSLIRNNDLPTRDIKMFIIDEADEMLSMGFKDQLYDLFQGLPASLQVGLFSATMPADALEITTNFMTNPIRILAKQEEVTLEGIRQFFVNCEQEQYKYSVLCDLYDTLNIAQTVIFCNTKRKVDWLATQLRAQDFIVSAMHAEYEMEQRSSILKDFKAGNSRILITTDLLARGIDVHGISMVINYELPRNPENYVHRIGRSGRFGRKGVSINLITPNDFTMMKNLESFYATQISEMPQDIDSYL